MPAARRLLLLRATTVLTVTALLFSLVGYAWAAPIAIPRFAITDNLISFWNMNETSGTRVDAPGTNDLAVTGTVGYGTGQAGTNSASFDAASYLSRADNADLSLDDVSFTITGWAYIAPTAPTLTDYPHMVAKGNSGTGREYAIYSVLSDKQFIFAIYPDGVTDQNAVVTISGNITDTTFFIAARYNRTTNVMRLSVSDVTHGGTYSNSFTSSGDPLNGTNAFQIGGRVQTRQYWHGAIDEVGLWDRELSDTELGNMLTNGNVCTYPFVADCVIATATPTTVAPSGNVIRNWDFDTAPRLDGSIWADMNRVVPARTSDVNLPIEQMPYGSCGPDYWVMSRTGGTDGRIWQDFGWAGGPMYLNFEYLTNNFATYGEVTLQNRLTGAEETLPTFTNGSMSWQTYKYVTGSKSAGQYRLGFGYDTFGPAGGLGVDNVNVRYGYWGNDCDTANYHGQMPVTTNATAAAFASPTPAGLQPNTPINQNCNFEQGWSGYAHNQAARLFYTGGATGPTYAYLFTVYGNGSDPVSPDLLGRVTVPFYWPGGQNIYVSYWTGPGTRATVTLRNNITGYTRQLQSPNTVQTYGGWVKRSQGFWLPNAGAYVLEMTSPYGQIAAFDGVAVSSGGFASGPCSSSNTTGDNNATATQHVANTQTAGTATNQPAVILTANQVATNQAGAYATYLAGQYATMTQHAAQTQTQGPAATQTQNAGATATRAAQQTATAQGTPVPPATVTRTPMPQPTGGVCVWDPTQVVWVCADPPTMAAPSGATLTAIAAEQTQFANAQATFWAQAQATADARAQQTQSAAGTQTAIPQAVQTQAAALQQTATARAQQTQVAALHATQTAIVESVNAQATANVAATQHVQQAAATQTAVAVAATVSAGNSTQQAEATNTAVAYATQYTGVTATAVAQLTQDAVNHANATTTAQAVATANAAATGVSLATQQAQQAQATQTAVAQQTLLAATANPTSQAQATATAQAYATTYAQVTATAQAQATSYSATQQASGTTVPGGGDGDLPPVDGRPEPSPGADCIRPTSPLQVANWIDYEVCRILTWWAWSPANSEQLADLESEVSTAFPFGFIAEVREVLDVFASWVTSLAWCETGFCRDQPLAPLNIEATGILVGNWDWSDGDPAYSDQCDLLMGPLVGPYIQSGMCFCVNVLCALGILPWAQLMFNVVIALMVLLYMQRTWLRAATS